VKLRISDKAKNVISAIAPTLGAALGGPLGGLAGNVISAALGGGDIDKAILAQNPETLLALRKAEQEFELKLQELGVEKERIAMADRVSARDMAKVNMKPQMVISACFLGGYFLVLVLRMGGVFDGKEDKVVDSLLTALTYGVPLILAFWFGSTAGSAVKSQLLYQSKPDNGD
jgi:hypothetical protein